MVPFRSILECQIRVLTLQNSWFQGAIQIRTFSQTESFLLSVMCHKYFVTWGPVVPWGLFPDSQTLRQETSIVFVDSCYKTCCSLSLDSETGTRTSVQTRRQTVARSRFGVPLTSRGRLLLTLYVFLIHCLPDCPSLEGFLHFRLPVVEWLWGVFSCSI